ncbi:PP2C family protein-serine/threonine phosphatase [Microbacterium lacticum]
MSLEYVVTAAACTDRGLTRDTNQDVAVVGDWASGADAAAYATAVTLRERAWACAVIDGMGGHANGEVAAWLTAHALLRGLTSVDDSSAGDQLAQRAHALVSDAGAGLGQPGMGAAFAGLVLGPRGYAVLNIGDCRVYRVVTGRLDLLTVDDSAPSRHDPGFFVLTQSIGGGAAQRLDAHYYSMPWEPGSAERFVLASDGLAVVREVSMPLARAPHHAASELIAAAIAAGAPDNVTVIVVDVVTGDGIGADASGGFGAGADDTCE